MNQIHNQTFAVIEHFANSARTVESVLILYEEKIQYIGDCCIRFDKFRYLSIFLNGAQVDINFTKQQNAKFAEGLLKNNPYLRSVLLLDWDQIDFSRYGAVYCIAYDERRLLAYFEKRYGRELREGRLCLPVFSLSEQILKPEPDSHRIFTVNSELAKFVQHQGPGELYISDTEIDWADEWLLSQGLRANEDLYVIVDSSSSREKLLKIPVYFELLTAILADKHIKVLIFDENDIGKEQFYAQWLASDRMKMIIVSRSLSLRQNLCLLASRRTKLIFGPCTGLMHCSSSIYNYFFAKNGSKCRIPLMITYTGYYEDRKKNAAFWWGNSPLINCLLLKKNEAGKKIDVLLELPEQLQKDNNNLPCSEYTSGMLLAFLARCLREAPHLAS